MVSGEVSVTMIGYWIARMILNLVPNLRHLIQAFLWLIVGLASLTACMSDQQRVVIELSDRYVYLEILSKDSAYFQITETYALRNREGFLIESHQSHFWQPGDEYGAGSLTVDLIFDHQNPIKPFVFWPNASRTHAENGNGFFMATPMNISVDTSMLTIGQHTMQIRVTTPDQRVFEHTWDFAIRNQSGARLSPSDQIKPTIEYLADHPVATSEFLLLRSDKPLLLDHFSPIGATEGLCFTVKVASDQISIAINGTVLQDDQFGVQNQETPGYSFVCVATNFLAAGEHLAEVTTEPQGDTHTWVFAILGSVDILA